MLYLRHNEKSQDGFVVLIDILLAINEIENEYERDYIGKLYQENASRVKYLSYKILRNEADAEETVNTIFILVIKYREKFVDVDEDETHRLLVIYTRSVCFNVLKKRNKIDFLSVSNACHDDEGHITDIELPDDVDILEELVKKETRKHLAAAIESLGEPTSLIVNLKYYHDMKNKDIAEMLEMNASTVSTILQRSMGILRKRLEEYMNGKDQ